MIANFYEFCYLCPRLGALLLEDSFEIKDEYFKSCYFVADILKVSKDKSQELIDDYCASLLFLQIGRLLKKENQLNPEYIKLEQNLTSCTVMALEAIFSDEGWKKAHSAVLHSIDEQNLSGHESYEFVINILSKQSKIKQKFPTITFGKPLK